MGGGRLSPSGVAAAARTATCCSPPLAGLDANGGTGLYGTVDAGCRAITRIWRRDQQNMLVVMTDGKNEDRVGPDLATLTGRLGAARKASRPVTVILSGYGSDADMGVPGQIGRTTGGRTYLARNPADIGKVFLAAMVNR